MRDTEEITFTNKIFYYRPDRKILQSGNSLYVSIPVEYVNQYKLVPGQMIKMIQDENGKLVLEPGPKPDLWSEKWRRKR